MSQPDKPIEVFISYSKHDLPLLEQLVSHLSNLQNEKQISVWYDRQMTAGEEWSDEINERLNSAGIVFLLVSHHFLSSDYCFDIELPRIIQRQDAGETTVIPILLRACEWEKAAFSQYQLLPSTRVPVTSWPNADEAFRDVVIGVRKAVEKLNAKPEPRKTEQAATPALSRSILRPLLPYLCDRSEQETELGVGLRAHQKEKNTRPIVCLIHGDEYEAHGQFLDRLRYRSLPKFLDLELKQVSVKDYPIQRPPRRNSNAMFWASLGEALLQDSSASQEEVWREIANHQSPMMFSLQLLTEDFEEYGESLIKSLIEFWAGWEDLPPGRSVINCICLKYQRLGKVGLFDFKKKKLQQLNQQLRALVERMEFSAYPNLTGIVLPELQAIARSDVESWLRKGEVREFCRLPDKEIRAMFEHEELRNDDGRIPMELLAERLKQFVES